MRSLSYFCIQSASPINIHYGYTGFKGSRIEDALLGYYKVTENLNSFFSYGLVGSFTVS